MTALAPIFNTLSRPATRVLVFMGDEDGNAPTQLEDYAPHLKPLSVRLGTGANSLDRIELEYLPEVNDDQYQDVTNVIGVNRLIEVRTITPFSSRLELLAWGKLASDGTSISRNNNRTTITASLDWFLLGGVLKTVPYWDETDTSAHNVTSEDLVFNPAVNGIVWGNRGDKEDLTVHAYYFHHREMTRTSQALALQSQTFNAWKIGEAVERVCGTINPSETHLTNPTRADVDSMIGSDDRDRMLRNVRIPRGTNLPDALDLILKPLGYTWFVEATGDLGSVTTKLRIIKFGSGVQKTLRLQRIGKTISNAETDVEQNRVTYDITEHPNQFYATTAPSRAEVTVKLYPAWKPLVQPGEPETEPTWEDLHKKDKYKRDGDEREVGHKWVYNEAGDYDGLRTIYTGARDIDAQGTNLAKRRRFYPCLTRSKTGEPIGHNGYFLEAGEFSFPGMTSDVRITFQSGFSVLRDELGVWLDDIPFEMWAAFLDDPDNFYLRLTACVDMDDGLTYTKGPGDQSPNGSTVPVFLDLSDRFRNDFVSDATDIKSRFYDDRHNHLFAVDVDAKTLETLFPADDQIAPGQRLSVESDQLSGTYTCKAVSGSTITVYEDIEYDGEPLTGTNIIALNTDSDYGLRRMQKYVDELADDTDFAAVKVNATLSGIDRREYERGDMITGMQDRNITFDGHAGTTVRAPQVLGLQYRFDRTQTTTLQLEQLEHTL